MPKLVDHDERRRDIAGAVLRVVARMGVRGADLRTVADEAGWSTGVINHYFGDKHALLVAALREAARAVREQMEASQLLKSGDDCLQALLEAGMPLDDDRAATCRIFFHFSAEGINDPDLRAELAAYYAWWRNQVRIAVEDAQENGRFMGWNSVSLSESLVGLAEGLGIQRMFDAAAMKPKRLRRDLAAMIDHLGSARGTEREKAHV